MCTSALALERVRLPAARFSNGARVNRKESAALVSTAAREQLEVVDSEDRCNVFVGLLSDQSMLVVEVGNEARLVLQMDQTDVEASTSAAEEASLLCH